MDPPWPQQQLHVAQSFFHRTASLRTHSQISPYPHNSHTPQSHRHTQATFTLTRPHPDHLPGRIPNHTATPKPHLHSHGHTHAECPPHTQSHRHTQATFTATHTSALFTGMSRPKVHSTALSSTITPSFFRTTMTSQTTDDATHSCINKNRPL